MTPADLDALDALPTLVARVRELEAERAEIAETLRGVSAPTLPSTAARVAWLVGRLAAAQAETSRCVREGIAAVRAEQEARRADNAALTADAEQDAAELRALRRLATVVRDPGAALRRIGWTRLRAEALAAGAEAFPGTTSCRAAGTNLWITWDVAGDGVLPEDVAEALDAVAAIWRRPAHAVLAELLP